MDDSKLLRYSRQIMLPQVDIKGQTQLMETTMLLIGIGGLGAISAQYLASSGVGHLILADFDRVELSNLQRQIIYNSDDIGRLKIEVAREKLMKINPLIKVTIIEKIDNYLDKWVKKSDIVLDGTDNFTTRFIINERCVQHKTPLVSAAVIRFEGQVATFKGYQMDKPCYHCLYPEVKSTNENCSDNGILAPVAGVLGSLQATQALKAVLNIGEQLDEKLLLIDLLSLNIRLVKFPKDSQCPVCHNI